MFASLLAFSCVLDPLVAPPLPAPPASSPSPLPLAPGALSSLSLANPTGVALYALQVGETRVSFGQFFGGHEGWVGKRGVRKTGSDRRSAWAPVVVYVAVHPEEGAILFDGGLSLEQTEAGYYSSRAGGRTAHIWAEGENRLATGDALLTQLEALGVAASDVRRVVISHLHEDHLGEVDAFPEAQVLLSELEWQDRGRVSYGPSFEQISGLETFDYTSGPFGPFGESLDLLGDGSVILLPTPGHTLGHTSALIRLTSSWALITGDALYTLRHLDPGALAPFNYFGLEGLETQLDGVERLAALQAELGAAVLLPPHDPSGYTGLLLEALADGALSEDERAAMLAYQAALYGEDGALLEAARPRYEGGAWALAEP